MTKVPWEWGGGREVDLSFWKLVSMYRIEVKVYLFVYCEWNNSDGSDVVLCHQHSRRFCSVQ